MKYKKCRQKQWKYELYSEEICQTEIKGTLVDSQYISLTIDGELTVHKGYRWDGPSGPVFHNKDCMRASLIHDALYQLMREGLLSRECRAQVDELFRQILLQDGMSKFWADIFYGAVKRWGKKAVESDMLEAP